MARRAAGGDINRTPAPAVVRVGEATITPSPSNSPDPLVTLDG
ncbi:hypothetical protein [Longimycelium tulufanense]|nr:hypothetical protein [Longimycelium tulufanense]